MRVAPSGLRIFTDVAAEFRGQSVVVFGPQAAAKGFCPAAFFDGSLCTIPPKQFLTEICIFWAHRRRLSGSIVHEGGGGRLEAEELGHESLGTVQLFLEFAEAEVLRAVSTCRVGRMSNGKGLAGIYSHFMVFNWRPVSSSPHWNPVRKA